MCECKRCGSESYVKNGKVRGKQRYKCSNCGYVYIDGNNRLEISNEVLDAIVVLLYSTGKASYGFIARLLGVSSPTGYIGG